MDTMKQTTIPDNGWTQHYDLAKELGDCFASVGDYEQAKRCYEKAATLEPDEAGPYVGTGVIALQQGRLGDAEIAFRVARRLDPTCSKAYCGLAMISQQQKKYQESFDYYLKTLELNCDDLTALLGLFQVSCQMGSFAKVIHYLEVYLQMHAADPAVMYCLATLYFKDSRYDKAKELLLDMLALDPTNTDAANLLEEVEHSLAQN